MQCRALVAALMPWAKETKATRRSGSGWEWQRTVKRILLRDSGVCHWCGGRATTADHVKAKAFGGSDEDSNLVAACQPCNMRRAHEQSKEGQRRKASRLRPREAHPGLVLQ
jgi:5-methylcytosine-specific restriction endonuclease McrA